MPFADDSHQGRRVELDAATHIKQASAALHLAEPRFIEQARGLFGHGRRHHHKVGQRQCFIKFIEPKYLLCGLAGTVRMLPHGDDAHSRRVRHLRQRTPDRTETDDKQR